MKSGFARIEKRISMIGFTKETVVKMQEFAETVSFEELAQALAIVKDKNGPRYQLPLGWNSTLGEDLRMAWNSESQKFEIDGYTDSYQEKNLKYVFTRSEREKIMASAIMSDERRAFIESIWDEV